MSNNGKRNGFWQVIIVIFVFAAIVAFYVTISNSKSKEIIPDDSQVQQETIMQPESEENIKNESKLEGEKREEQTEGTTVTEEERYIQTSSMKNKVYPKGDAKVTEKSNPVVEKYADEEVVSVDTTAKDSEELLIPTEDEQKDAESIVPTEDVEEPSISEEPSVPEDSENPVIPSNPEKPNKPNKPHRPNRPSGGGSSGGTTTPEQHEWSQWTYKDNDTEERVCSHCDMIETRAHTFELIQTTFEDKNDGTHSIKRVFKCSTCEYNYDSEEVEQHTGSIQQEYTSNQDGTHEETTKKVCTVCANTSEETQTKDCVYGQWQYEKNGTDVAYCSQCNHMQTRSHQHEEAPADIQYVFKETYNNGTHKMEAAYICQMCGVTTTAYKDETCEYDVSYRWDRVYDYHTVISQCNVCKYTEETEERCDPVGELQYVSINGNVYEYYECKWHADGMARHKDHVEHHYGEWEPYDTIDHIRSCPCKNGPGRDEKDIHMYNVEENGDKLTFYCEICGDSRTAEKHNHGFGVYDGMDLVDLVMTQAFYELKTMRPEANPNPSIDAYCNRLRFVCNTCGIGYNIFYEHEFDANGKCTLAECTVEGPVQTQLDEEVQETNDETLEDDFISDDITDSDDNALDENLDNEDEAEADDTEKEDDIDSNDENDEEEIDGDKTEDVIEDNNIEISEGQKEDDIEQEDGSIKDYENDEQKEMKLTPQEI